MYLSTVPQIDSTDMIMTHTSFQGDGSPLINTRFRYAHDTVGAMHSSVSPMQHNLLLEVPIQIIERHP